MDRLIKQVVRCHDRGVSGVKRSFPGEFLLRPSPIAAIALLVLNDRLFKHRWPGWLTGKLSDLAGVFLLPLVLLTLLEVGRRFLGRQPWTITTDALAFGLLGLGVAFASVKLWEPAADAFRIANGWLRWPMEVAAELMTGGSPEGPRRIALTRDPTDLVVLPVLGLTYLVARPNCRVGRSGRVGQVS